MTAPAGIKNPNEVRRHPLLDLLHVLMRTAHLVSSAAWVGGSIFYAWVLLPQLRGSEEGRGVSPALAASFGRVVGASAWTLLATGGYLTFDRLTNARLGAPYALVLALKLLLVVWMFLLAGALGRRRTRPSLTHPSGHEARRVLLPAPTLVLLLGLAVFLLSAALTTIYGATPAAR